MQATIHFQHKAHTNQITRPDLSTEWKWKPLLLLLLQVASVMSDSVQPQRWQPTRLPYPWDSPGKNTGLGCHFHLQCMKVKNESEVTQLCLTLSDPMDCSLPGSSIHGIFQARVLEWGAKPLSHLQFFVTSWTTQSMEFVRSKYWNGVAFPFPRGSFQPRDPTQVSHIAGGFFTSWVKTEAQECWSG